MSSIASLLVSLKADFGDADSKFDSFIGKMKDVDDQEEDTEDHLRHLKDGAEEGGEGLEGLGEILSDLTGELVKCAAEAFALTSVFETLKEAVTISANLDSARVAMDTFTGSAEKTSEVMENLEKIANSEALSFKEVVPAAQRMLAMGFSTEQTEKAIKAAGNAAWALNEPLQTVTQRMSQMALSGMANQRMLRTLGVSSEEMARVMGVSLGEVTKAFQSVDKDAALETLTEALGKFGDQGAKQAEHVKGEWVNLKNAWEEAFDDMGKDLQPLAKSLEGLGVTTSAIFKEIVEDMKKMGDEFPILAHLAVTAGQVIVDSFTLISDALSNNKSIDALKIFKESLDKGITYAEASKQAHARANQTVQGVIPENVTTGPLGEQPKDLKSEYQKGLGPEKAKEAAGIQLAIIAGQKDAVKQSAALARERVETEINANHVIVQSGIDAKEQEVKAAENAAKEEVRLAQEKAKTIGGSDANKGLLDALERQKTATENVAKEQVAHSQSTANEEVRVAQEKASRIGAINISEAKAQQDLVLKEKPLKIAQTYQGPREDETKRAATIKEVNIKTDNEIAKSNEDLADKQQKLSDNVVQVTSKGNAKIVTDTQKSTEITIKAWDDYFNAVMKDVDELVKTYEKIREVQTTASGEDKTLKLKQQQISLEGEYSQQLSHTNQEELAHLQQVAALEAAQRQTHIDTLKQQVTDLGPQSQDTNEKAEKRVQLEAQIQQATQENANALQEAANTYAKAVQDQNNYIQAQKTLANFTQQGQNINLGTALEDLVNEFTKLPEMLGSSLSSILFHHSKGDSAGKQIGEAFRQMGQQLAGKLISDAIQKLLSEIILQTGLQAAFNALFPTVQTGSTTAIVGAIGASATSIVTAITTASGVGAGIGGGASAGIGAVGSAASGALGGGLIAAAGGVIGGVISAITTWLGDNKIVKAVNATTAAVLSLKGTTSLGGGTTTLGGGTTTGTGTSTTSSTSDIASSITGALSHIPILSGILGSFGATGTPVRIVGIDPGVLIGNSIIGGLAGLIGLAGGGDLEIGRPTIVGEKGRELIIPRGAGTVIPNDKTEDLISSSLLNVSPASSLSAHTNSLSALKAYNSYQGNPSNFKSGGDTNISLHGANFYGVTNTREMMRQIADYSRNQKIGQSYNNG